LARQKFVASRVDVFNTFSTWNDIYVRVLAYASSCRLADEKSDALVNIDLKIKALNDKIRTTAASVDKFEEESAKIKDQRCHQEASFVKSRGPSTPF